MDKKRLYLRDFKKGASFRKWGERVVKWFALDRPHIGENFVAAAKSETKFDLQDDPEDRKYIQAVYIHLQNWTENHEKAAKLVATVKGENVLEAWRNMSRRFDPQTAEIHGGNLRAIVLFGEKNKCASNADVQPTLDVLEKLLDTYEERVGEEAVNEVTKKHMLMQLIPAQLLQFTRDAMMAAHTNLKTITYDSLKELIVERVEADEV